MDIPTVAIELITPEMAESWLDSNFGNRKLRKSWSKELAYALNRGEWLISNDAIVFDDCGRLLNGQHRLDAICESGVSANVIVMRNANTESFKIMDRGAKRTFADATDSDKRVAQAVRLASQYYFQNKPSVQQFDIVLNSQIGVIANKLIGFCGTSSKYYSSAPIKLAAVLSVADGENEDFVFSTYASLVKIDIESMPVAAKALMRQVTMGTVNSLDTRDTLARGLKVFKSGGKNLSFVRVSDSDIEAAVAYARSVVSNCVNSEARA